MSVPTACPQGVALRAPPEQTRRKDALKWHGQTVVEAIKGVALLLPEISLAILLFVTASLLPGGMMTQHMLAHIVLMNVAAPVIAWGLIRSQILFDKRNGPAPSLGIATCIQLAAFFFWHSPQGMAASMESPIVRSIAMGSLFGAAAWFWLCVLLSIRQGKLLAIAALMLTGKLVCLVAAILVFAPRLLYPGMPSGTPAMDDQQLAGLIMLTACPLTYVGASIAVTAQWFNDLSKPAGAE